jgi:hypothetical protein
MRLKSLLIATMLIASPVRAQQQPPGRSDTPLPSPPAKEERLGQTRVVEDSTPSVDASPESIARVRTELEKPPPVLTPTGRKADFSVHIEKRVPLQEIFELPPWATSGVAPGWGPAGSRTSSPTLVSVDVLPLLLAAKRAYAERSAREEVKQAIADYCAGQPNAGAGIQICAPAR